MMLLKTSGCRHERDAGTVLPLVLVMTVVLSVVIVAVASFVRADLQYGRVTEVQADLLASAEGGFDHAVDRLANGDLAVPCGVTGSFTYELPGDPNGVDRVDVTCDVLGGGVEASALFAAIITGEGAGALTLLATQEGVDKEINGPIYIADPLRTNIQGGDVILKTGPLWYSDTGGCSPELLPSDLESPPGGGVLFEPGAFGMRCWTVPWDDPLLFGDFPDVPDFTGLPDTTDKSGTFVDVGACRVFGPGVYTNPPQLISTPPEGRNYFRNGDYFFDDVLIDLSQNQISAGYDGDALEIANPDCDPGTLETDAAVVAALGPTDPSDGVTFYMGGSSYVDIQNKGKLEVVQRTQPERDESMHALDTDLTVGNAASVGGARTVPASSLTAMSPNSLIYSQSGSTTNLVMHGLVWAPNADLTLDNVTGGSYGQLVGGVVAATLDVDVSPSTGNFAISVDSEAYLSGMRITSVAIAPSGAQVAVTGTIDYDSAAPLPPDRVEVESFRVIEN